MYLNMQDGMGIRVVPVVWRSSVSETPENHSRSDGGPFRERVQYVAEEDNVYVFGRHRGRTREIRRPR